MSERRRRKRKRTSRSDRARKRRKVVDLTELENEEELPKKNDDDVVLIENPPPSEEEEQVEEGRKCAICLSAMKERGVIDSCHHLFCFRCIRRWSKTSNVCPVCRQRFRTIRSRDVRKRRGKRKRKKKKKKLNIPRRDFRAPAEFIMPANMEMNEGGRNLHRAFRFILSRLQNARDRVHEERRNPQVVENEIEVVDSDDEDYRRRSRIRRRRRERVFIDRSEGESGSDVEIIHSRSTDNVIDLT